MWFETYKNKEQGIEIKCPSGWLIKEQDEDPFTVFFLTPLESSSDRYRENISLSVEQYKEAPLSLEQYSNRMIHQLETHIENFNLTKRNDANTLLNSPACSINFTGSQKNLQLKWMQIWAITKDNLYMITYTAETKKFNKYNTIVKTMIRSFRIL